MPVGLILKIHLYNHVRKVPQITPKVVKTTSTLEIMCDNITFMDHSSFLNLQRTQFEAIYHVLSAKNTSRNTPETRKPVCVQQESQKQTIF